MEAMKDYVAHLDNKKKNYAQRSCLSVLQCKRIRKWLYYSGTSGTHSAREHFSQNFGRYGSCGKQL